MSAKFFDLHDENNPDNGAELFDGSGVRALLSRNSSSQAFFAELISDHQTRLLIGLGLKIGCVQFSDLTGDPPYLVANLESEKMRSGITEFSIGNEPTEVELRLCIPFAALLDVAAYFVETGQRSPIVSWEEI